MSETREDLQKVKLRAVRLSFPGLWSPKESKDGRGKPSYQANFLVPKKDKKQIALVETAIENAIDAWEKKNPKSGRFPDIDDLSKNEKCWRDGENRRGEPLYDGYEGCMVLAARNSKRPGVVDVDKSPLVEDDGKPYAGCYVNAIVRIWIQDNDNGLALRCSLEAVQFLKDGEAFGAAPVDTDEEFDDESGADTSSRRRNREEDDEDERPSRSRRSRDDEDERPARRRPREEEDEKPARRRSGGDAEDERPARNRRRRDEDDDLV